MYIIERDIESGGLGFLTLGTILLISTSLIAILLVKRHMDDKYQGFDLRYFKGTPKDITFSIAETLSFLNLKFHYTVGYEGLNKMAFFKIEKTDLRVRGLVVEPDSVIVMIGKIHPLNINVANWIKDLIIENYDATQ
jgi:hypothetical protein